VPLVELRSWIRQQLAPEGDVLRWALTEVRPAPDGGRTIQVEAVISA
jgi:hypothetical protein